MDKYFMLIHRLEAIGREREEISRFSLNTHKLKKFVTEYMKATGCDGEDAFWYDDNGNETLRYGAIYSGFHTFIIKRVPKEMIL